MAQCTIGVSSCRCLTPAEIATIVVQRNLTYALIAGTQYPAFQSGSIYPDHYGVGCAVVRRHARAMFAVPAYPIDVLVPD